MGLLQQDEAVFYHPLDDTTEVLKSQAWTLSPGSLAGAGKISNAMSGTGGDSVAFGAESEFVGTVSGADNISVAALSASKSVVAYKDNSDSGHGTARIVTVSGTAVTVGAEAEFLSAGNAFSNSVAALSATKFVVVYRDDADSLHGTAKVGTVSGTDITFGAETEFLSTGDGAIPSTAALSETKFVVVYRDATDSSHGTAKVGTVSGTDITFGAETEFLSAGSANDIFTAALSATAFIVVYTDNADSNHGTAKVGTVSGTDITFGAEAEFLSTGLAGSTSIAVLSATVFVVAYQDGGDAAHGTAKVGTVAGTSITFGAESEFASAGPAISISVSALDSSIVLPAGAIVFVVAYSVLDGTWQSEAKVGTVSGTDITFGAAAVFIATNSSASTSVSALSTTKFVVTYSDNADSGFGKVRVGALAGAASLTASTPAAYDSAAAATKLAFCGWFKEPSA